MLEISKHFLMKFSILTPEINLCILYGKVCSKIEMMNLHIVIVYGPAGSLLDHYQPCTRTDRRTTGTLAVSEEKMTFMIH